MTNWTEIPWRPSDRVLRQFAATGVVVGALVAWRIGSPATVVVGVLAGITALAGWLAPQSLRLPFVALSIAAFPVGWLVSRLIMAAMFFGVFTPIGLLFRLIRRDALALKLDSERASYWEPRPEATEAKRYFTQY